MLNSGFMTNARALPSQSTSVFGVMSIDRVNRHIPKNPFIRSIFAYCFKIANIDSPMKFFFRYLCIFLLFTTTSVLAQLAPNQRYMALLLLNLSENDANLDLIEETVKIGLNAVHLTVHWDQVYPTATSTPNWRKIDSQINLAQKLGVKVALRIHLGRNEGRLQGFWKAEDRQKDAQNKLLSSGYAASMFSYAHRPSVEQAKDFIKEVCQRYNYVQQQGGMAWVSVTTTPTQEVGYHYDNRPEGNLYAAVFDYSLPMLQEFRIWVSRKYKKIARLNAIWQTEFENFEKIMPPIPPKNLRQVFWDEAGKDWYLFRHAVLKQFIEQTTQTIKAVNPNYKVITDWGSVFDELAPFRASYGFVDLNKLTDGIKSNDDVLFDNRFSADVVRSNARPDQWILNEVFTAPQTPVEELQKQVDENFEHGNHWISFVMSIRADLDKIRPVLQTSVARWLKTPYKAITPRASMSYALSRVLEFGYFSGGVYGEWANKAGPEGARQPVEIKLIEDLLLDTLQGTLNRVPIVKNSIPNKIVRVNTPFSYQLSSEVFMDIDGAIINVTIQNLPDWLKFSNGLFTGTPTRLGTYKMILRATDDDGANVETTFTIVVDNTGRINQRPTVRQRPKNAIGLYKQSFVLPLSDSIFTDNDGFITRVEVVGLPTWLQYRRGELRGVPDTAQVYVITLRAFDDENATTETSFNITINYPKIYFDLIQAGKPGQRFLLKRLQNNETLAVSELPQALNVYASCDAIFDAFDLRLSGPYIQNTQSKRSPFALFDGDNGFPTVVGTYQLQGTAYFRKEKIASATYQFQLANIDPVSKKLLPLDIWAVYPNPFQQFLNVMMPNGSKPKHINIITPAGIQQTIPLNNYLINNQILTINFNSTNITAGLYFLRIQAEDDSIKTFKVIKF